MSQSFYQDLCDEFDRIRKLPSKASLIELDKWAKKIIDNKGQIDKVQIYVLRAMYKKIRKEKHNVQNKNQ